MQGTASVNALDSASCRWNCNSGDGCDKTDFLFGGASDDFTFFMFVRPTDNDASARVLFGTDMNLTTSDTGGWAVYIDGSDFLCFQTHDSAGGSEAEICDTSAITFNEWQSVAVTYDGVDDDAWLELNGTQVATSGSMVQPDATTDAGRNVALGRANIVGATAMAGQYDQIAVYAGRITKAWRTRIQVCLIDGSACSCNTSDPTQYLSRPRHVSQGGPIEGPMPACNDLTVDTE